MQVSKSKRVQNRVTEKIHPAGGDAGMLYTVKVQVRVAGLWLTIWSETCDYSDGDTRPYIKNCAQEVADALNETVKSVCQVTTNQTYDTAGGSAQAGHIV